VMCEINSSELVFSVSFVSVLKAGTWSSEIGVISRYKVVWTLGFYYSAVVESRVSLLEGFQSWAEKWTGHAEWSKGRAQEHTAMIKVSLSLKVFLRAPFYVYETVSLIVDQLSIPASAISIVQHGKVVPAFSEGSDFPGSITFLRTPTFLEASLFEGSASGSIASEGATF